MIVMIVGVRELLITMRDRDKSTDQTWRDIVNGFALVQMLVLLLHTVNVIV